MATPTIDSPPRFNAISAAQATGKPLFQTNAEKTNYNYLKKTVQNSFAKANTQASSFFSQRPQLKTLSRKYRLKRI